MAQLSFSSFCFEVAKHLGMHPNAATELTRAVVRCLAMQVRLGHEVALPGVGTLGTKRVGAKTVPHPRTGEPVEIEEHRYPRLRPAKDLVRAVKQLKG